MAQFWRSAAPLVINELNGSTFASQMSQAQKGGTVEELQKLQAHSCRGILKVLKAGMRSGYALWFPDVFTVNSRGKVPAMSRAQDGRFCFGSCRARFLKDVHSLWQVWHLPVMLRSSRFLCVTGAGHPTLFDLCGRRPLFGPC